MGGLQEKVNSLAIENKSLVEDLRSAKDGIRTATGQTSHLSQENDLLKRRIVELETSSRKLSEYDIKINTQSQEIDRLNQQLRQSGDIQNRLMLAAR